MTQLYRADISDQELNKAGQNSLFLKAKGLAFIQNVCEQNWTDHNHGDPGVTMLDVLAFVISDISYRLAFPVNELLAEDPSDSISQQQQPFYLAPQILPSNSVTLADQRRMIMDISGVKNASLVLVESTHQGGANKVNILLDSEDDLFFTSDAQQLDFYNKVRHVYLAERNVNQDLNALILILKHDLSVSMALNFERISTPVDAVVNVLKCVQSTLSPQIMKLDVSELVLSGYSGDEIFDGPRLKNGTLLETQLDGLDMPKIVYASDLFEALEHVEGLTKIRAFAFSTLTDSDLNYDEGYLSWRFKINDHHMPRLDVSKSLEQLDIAIDGQSYQLTAQDKQAILAAFTLSTSAITSEQGANPFSTYVTGRYREINKYVSIQQEFPTIYKLAESRLDDTITTQEQAQIMQLKGYLTLFDQVLSDQCAQLDNLRKLLALPNQSVYLRLGKVFASMLASEPLSRREIYTFWQDVRALPLTRLSQPITNISGAATLLGSYFKQYQKQGFSELTEPTLGAAQLDRLTRSMEHLLARFAETSIDVNLLKYKSVFAHYLADFSPTPADISADEPLIDKLVALKKVLDLSVIINNYPSLSRYRCGGFNYLQADIATHHLAGLSKRIMTFMGFSHMGQMPLATNNRESFYLLEGLLIANGAIEEPFCSEGLFFVIPEWPSRLANENFKRLLNDEIQRACPVHLSPVIFYLNRPIMSLFERVYYAWLNANVGQPLRVCTPSIMPENEAQTDQSITNRNAFCGLLTSLLVRFTNNPDGFPITLLEAICRDVGKQNGLAIIEWGQHLIGDTQINAQLMHYADVNDINALIEQLKIKLPLAVREQLIGDDVLEVKALFEQLLASDAQSTARLSLRLFALSIEIAQCFNLVGVFPLDSHDLITLIENLTQALKQGADDSKVHYLDDMLFVCLVRLCIKVRLAPEHRGLLNGLSLAQLYSELVTIFNANQAQYSDLCIDHFMVSICHQYLELLIEPKSISEAQIGASFRVGYQQLRTLKSSYPIGIAQINSTSEIKQPLTLAINKPFDIN